MLWAISGLVVNDLEAWVRIQLLTLIFSESYDFLLKRTLYYMKEYIIKEKA